MTDADLVYQHLKRLPDSIVAKVFDVVQFLEHKNAKVVSPVVARNPSTALGQVWMAADFDAPFDDFKDYQ